MLRLKLDSNYQRTYKLEETSYNGGQGDLEAKMTQVIQRSNECAEKIQLGVFYQNEHIPTYKEKNPYASS